VPDDPIGDDGGEARDEDVSPLMGSCLDFEMPEVRG
jgi:hypothetical protein